MFPPFEDIEILTPAQCDEICTAVHHLRRHWTQVNAGTNFYTLGAASYIEFCRPGEAAERYYGKARALNPVLRQHFPGIMEHLRATLETYLGAPVAFAEQFGRPGFHIWLTDAIPLEPSASVHFDLQYQKLGWPAPAEVDYGRPLSFTLPLRLPAGGGGVNVWDIHYRETEEAARRNEPFDVEGLRRVRALARYPYARGRLVLHSGHFLHQIAPAEEVRPGDERITMQGHAMRCAGRWLVYW